MTALRVVILCCDGPFQHHLLQRAAEEFSLVGAVLHRAPEQESKLARRLRYLVQPIRLVRHLTARLLLGAYERSAQPVVRTLFHRNGQPPRTPAGVPLHVTADINSAGVVAFIRERAPDIVLVNGTPLLRGPVLALLPEIRLGIINLHTGLSPYSRGGNCNLFMLLENHPELVGVTIHHIDAGIDSGDIILTAQVPMAPGDNFEMIDARTFHFGIELLLSAARQLQEGRATRVRQWEHGKLFLRRTGYVYEPYHRLRANRALARGLVRDYLANRQQRDAGVRLVRESPP